MQYTMRTFSKNGFAPRFTPPHPSPISNLRQTPSFSEKTRNFHIPTKSHQKMNKKMRSKNQNQKSKSKN